MRAIAGFGAVVLAFAAATGIPSSATEERPASGDHPVTPTDRDEGRASFVVGYRNETSQYRVNLLTVLPGRAIRIRAGRAQQAEAFTFGASAGRGRAVGDRVWEWEPPQEPGAYSVWVARQANADTVWFSAFVLVPFAAVDGEHLNGYRIGRYPESPFRGLPTYQRPRGFIEVTPDNEGTWISPHFQLAQFLCKQQGGYPKYVVLQERLLLKLEYLLDRVRKAGYAADGFHVLSGYRTPFYNAAIGNVRYSGHVFGMAADIFIDQDGDEIMDDLNGDGRHDVNDAQALYALVDRQVDEDEYQTYIGGLGRYRRTTVHGPFVHVDVRGYKARW